MDFKEAKFQISLDSVRSICHKIKQKGVDFLDVEELAICAMTPGFQQVCRNLGVDWTAKHQKQALDKIRGSNLDISWLTKKAASSAQFAPVLVHCARGDITKVKEIVKRAPKEQKELLIQTVDATKKSALHIAAKEGYEVLVEYLLAEGFGINARDRELKTALHYSCIQNQEVVSGILIEKKCDTFARDNKGCLPIHYAVCGTSSKVVSQLLQINPRLTDSKDYTGKTPLHFAVLSTTENQIDIIRLLIENGSKVNEKDDEGRTPLHYASDAGKSRCIPILLKNKANITLKDNLKKTPLQLASNERITKLLQTYGQDRRTSIPQYEQKELHDEFESKMKSTSDNQRKIDKMKQQPLVGKSDLKHEEKDHSKPIHNNAVLGGDINQVSTWLREKLFVLLKKLQESGVKSKFHVKRPYIYTGSWMENVDSIEDLYSIMGQVSGPQVAMRVFNILCPYEKKLPTGLGKIEAVEGFFGESWFGTQPVQQVKKAKGEQRLRKELNEKEKQIEQMKIEIAGLQVEISRLESDTTNLNDELRQYKKMQEEVRKQRTKSAQQYSQILKLTNQNEELRKQVAEAYSGDDEVEKLNMKIEQFKKKNEEYQMEIESLKSYEAAARRKCGKMFLKALQNPQEMQMQSNTENLYDDDSIIKLYELLEANPPSLLKRLQAVDRNGDGRLSVEQFNTFLERLKMLPQDILAMNRIVGFVSGRKHLGFDQFKDILQSRPQLRVQWEKKLIQKLKQIIEGSEVGSVEKLFKLLDVDESGSVTLEELRVGLEAYNIFINQSDLSNLFSLLDADKSGTINLEEFQTLLGKEQSNKKVPELDPDSFNKQKPKKSIPERQQPEPDKSVDDQNQQQISQKPESDHNPYQDEIEEDQNQVEQVEKVEQEDVKSDSEQERNQQCDVQQQDHKESRESEANKSQQQQQQQNYEQQGNEQEANQSDKPEEDQEKPEASGSSQQADEAQQQEIGPRVTGIFKLQIRFCEGLVGQQSLEKIAIQFLFGKEEIVKVGDFSKKKWQIAVKFQVSNKLEATIPGIQIAVWRNREFSEANYLGEVEIDSRMLMETPEEWVVNGPVGLEAKHFEKEVSGSIGVQARWKPMAELVDQK